MLKNLTALTKSMLVYLNKVVKYWLALAVWLSGNVLVIWPLSMNLRLVLGWVIVLGSTPGAGKSQYSRPGQLSLAFPTCMGRRNEYQPQGGDALWQIWFVSGW